MEDIDNVIILFLSGDLDVKKLRLLKNWIELSPANRTYFREMCIIGKGASIVANADKFDANQAYRQIITTQPVVKKKTYRHRLILKIVSAAAVLLLFFAAGNCWTLNMQMQKLNYLVEVPNGAKSKVVFPDGSVVWLNAGSKLAYDSDFALRSRTVHFEGEGYFEVMTDKTLPFIVNTEGLNVKVLGTKFNLKAYKSDQNMKVALKEGAVWVTGKDTSSIVLRPNQQVVYTKDNQTLQVEDVLPVQIDAWRNGIIRFDDVKLQDIVSELERIYGKSITINSNVLKNITYYSDFTDNQTLNEILDILSQGNKFKYNMKGDNVLLFI